MPAPADVASVSIVVNGEDRSVPAGSSVGSLVESMALPSARVAVELNRSIVPKGEWSRPLADGDRLEIVAFVGGG